MEWKPIETAPLDKDILAWADNWHWERVEKAYRHSDFNGHKGVICRGGCAGAPFRLGHKDAPTHWIDIPMPPNK
jgi:hypothetical protein